ncbi:MAG: hypothetical protein IKH26_00600 [Bacteroidaceae bacterium]|nr:hypothetical protein [Bacteroidaceae bacterium]
MKKNKYLYFVWLVLSVSSAVSSRKTLKMVFFISFPSTQIRKMVVGVRFFGKTIVPDMLCEKNTTKDLNCTFFVLLLPCRQDSI